MQSASFEIRIAHLYPDLLNANGDFGNILTFQNRCQWRDIGVKLTEIKQGDKINADDFDFFFASSAQGLQLELASIEFQKNACELKRAAKIGKPMLVIFGSYQLFGNYYKISDSKKLDGISIFDTFTIASPSRYTGNVTAVCDFLNPRTIVGFENHCDLTYLNENALPFLRVQTGNGNNGGDKTEGARFNNAFGTYLCGPILPKNPHFCDLLIKLALKSRYGCDIPLLPLNDEIEYFAHQSRIKAKY